MVELLVDELKKSHQVMLLTTQPEDVKNFQVDGNLTICRYNPKNIYHLLNDYKRSYPKKLFWHLFDLFNFKVARRMKWEIKKFDPEMVITHNLKGFSFQIPRIIRKLKIFHVHVLHDYQLIDPQGSLYRQGQNLRQIKGFYRFYSIITKKLINNPNLVISPSKFVLNKHLEYGFFKRSKIVVLPNPCLISPMVIPKSGLRKIETDNSIIRFLYLGQIEAHKGVEFLTRVFMKYNSPQSQLIIAGEGSQLPYIKNMALLDERIKILGKVKREEFNDLFGQADILIVPSLWWENLPTVIYEAYGNQIPVLASDSGGSKELIKEGETGWIFKANDENDLLAKLNYLNSIKGQLADYGKKGYEFIQQYSADKYVQRLLELCQSLRK